MNYNQKVKIKNIAFEKVSSAFHSIKIVKFLTGFQPVQIIEWSGIENGKRAHFKLWFFGWKNFKVKHESYMKSNNELFFIDRGIELPLGVKYWKHKHIIKRNGEGVIIQDLVSFSHANIFMEYLLFPILMFPIIIRKLFYKIYFWKYNC